MPTYQYACTACGQELEAVQSFSDASLTTCPACEGRLRKVYGAVGVVFKGSGFYKTDSRKKESVGSSSGESGTSTGSGEGAAKNGSTSETSTSGSKAEGPSKGGSKGDGPAKGGSSGEGGGKGRSSGEGGGKGSPKQGGAKTGSTPPASAGAPAPSRT